MKPKFQTKTTKQPDSAANGQAAKAYRNQFRVTLGEVAERITTPQGEPMTVSNLHNYERGINGFTEAMFSAYLIAVDDARNSSRKPKAENEQPATI